MKQLALALVLAAAVVAPAQAVVVTFDSLSGTGVLPSSFGGINWGNNWRYFDAVQVPYAPASGAQRIFRNYSIWGVDTAQIPFTFGADVVFQGAAISGYASNPVTFLLYNNGSLVHTSASFAPTSIPVFAASGYAGAIDEVRVSGRQIMTIDNVTFNLADGPGGPGGENGVPEPAAWVMLITGFGLTGALLRRRRAAAAGARRRPADFATA